MNTERLHLLIVEDEEAHVEAIRRAFDAAGTNADIHAVGTLREYYEYVAAHPLDLVLIDLNLPDGRAVEILTHPPEDGPFPILVMTAFGNQQIVVEVMKAGALDYVVKSPEAFATLPRTVEHLLREWKLLQSHKRAEKALRENEQRFRGFVENISDIVYEMTPEGIFTYVSPNWLDLIGEPAADAIGKSFESYMHPDDVRPCREFLERAFSTRERLTSMDYRILRRDKAIRWHYSKGIALCDPEGNAVGFLGISRDITERKRAEEALEEEAIRRRILIEESNDGIMILDTDGKVFEANRRSAEMLGYSPDEVRQLHVWDWDAKWTREQLMEMFRSVDASGAHFETRHRRKDGTVYDAEISTNMAICGGRKLIFSVCRDITERKQAEEALVAIKERLQNTLSSMTQGYYAIDRDWRVVDVNAMAEKHFGKPAAELIGGTLEQATQGRIPDNVREGIQHVMTSGQPQQLEVKSKVQPGTWATNYIYPRDGGAEVYFTDITERKQAEEALRQQTEELRARNVELERFNDASVGRELRMIELKQEVNQLCQQVGLPARYPLNSAEESERISDNTPPKKPGQP